MPKVEFVIKYEVELAAEDLLGDTPQEYVARAIEEDDSYFMNDMATIVSHKVTKVSDSKADSQSQSEDEDDDELSIVDGEEPLEE